jgi:hypothetical protein
VVVINARTGKRHLIWAEIDSNPSAPEDRVLIIRPGRNFDEGERYIVALRYLKDASGKTLEAQRTSVATATWSSRTGLPSRAGAATSKLSFAS